MSLSDKLTDDLKKALKNGDSDTLSVIRMIKSAVKNREIEKGGVLEDDEISAILMTLSRQSKDSIKQFKEGGRQDLAEKESKELLIIQSYLPKQLTEKELEEIITNVIEEVKPDGIRDMGMVMKSLMPRVKGRADGRQVNELVKKILIGRSSNRSEG